MAEPGSRDKDRLYMEVARQLVAQLVAGNYPIGSRLPAERELAVRYGVSRATAREAIIALEAKGFVEVRVGSGAYVLRLPGDSDVRGGAMSAFELTEARLLIEGEAAALAASQITDDQLADLAGLVMEIGRENNDPRGTDRADRRFHLAIARATRNPGIESAVLTLWDLRDTSAEAALVHERARTAHIKPVVAEHQLILEALRARDPVAARGAMRAHLAAVIKSLLFAAEQHAVGEVRDAARAQRQRYEPDAP